MSKQAAIFLTMSLLWMSQAQANRDRGSWKKPLHEKAVSLEMQIQERHDIVGSYPSMVQLVPPKHYAGSQQGAWKKLIESGELPTGWIVDHGTTGVSNIAHTSSWTGCYLTGMAFRVAMLKEKLGEESDEYKQAYERASKLIGAIRILTLVTGQPGYLARGVALGHGIGYEERGGTEQRDLWGQGVGEFSHLRYRGGPSHHNYDHVFRGLGIYYVLAADDTHKEMIREIVSDMSAWAHHKHNMVVMHVDGKTESTVLIGGWRGLGGDDRPSGGSLMALTGLKISYLVTGNPKSKQLYDSWIEKLGLKNPAKTSGTIMGQPRSNYDDTDHLLGDLYLLNLIEKDPQLVDYYRKCVKDSWEIHQDDKMAWFNFVYRAVLGDPYGDPEGSLWNLQSHPTSRVLQPQMNSIRTDIQFTETDRGKQALHPLPLYERPSDNEYLWKGSPYALDGWLARTVSVLEVSPHDPYVQFAADTSGISYLSNTKGQIWHQMEGLPRVNQFLFSLKYPWIAFAATDGGVYRTLSEGQSWGRVFDRPALQVEFDPRNPMVLIAVGRHGLYKSADFGERDMGTRWRTISGDAPTSSDAAFAIDLRGKQSKLYMLRRDGFYSKAENDAEWTAFPRAERERGFSDVDAVGGRPLWLRIDLLVTNRLFRAVESRSRRLSGVMITVSDDAGQTWSPILRELKAVADWQNSKRSNAKINRDELLRMYERSRKFRISDLRLDNRDPNTWYGQLEDGVAITRDGGKTWTTSRSGLDIPRVGAIYTPRHAGVVMVGTPAGMYTSHDKGQSWTDTTLIPQSGGAIRTEIGGIGYLTAYWMGRYHNFVTEEQANEKFWE
jgi:photosystem II stability/assembly factor-like uncharacterized protein